MTKISKINENYLKYNLTHTDDRYHGGNLNNVCDFVSDLAILLVKKDVITNVELSKLLGVVE